MRDISLNEKERKEAYEHCAVLALGFQNKVVGEEAYNILQELYGTIMGLAQPIRNKEKMYRNEERGVIQMCTYLGLPRFTVECMLNPELKDDDVLAKYREKGCKLSYVGDFHEAVKIERNGETEIYKIEGAEVVR